MLFQTNKSFSFLFTGLSLILSVVLLSCDGNTPTDIQSSSAYLSRVFNYVYAPGQHSLLASPADTTHIVGEPTDNKGWLYLGGFGGYVVAGFDHNVVNGDGNDFEVYALQGASPEPGIVYVMPDTNGDGLPNETWYELKGNRFANSHKNYWVRYYKAATATSNITWKDSEGTRGELISHYGGDYSAAWWWTATPTDSITFHGTRLPDAYDNNSNATTEQIMMLRSEPINSILQMPWIL